ncbi:hypothetical protein, partial [Phaeodactylibacter luteus]
MNNLTLKGRSSVLSFFLLLFGAVFGAQQASAQCTEPANVTVGYGCNGVVTISWDEVGDASTYTVDIENAMGNPVVDYVNMAETTLTITSGTLTPGEDYNFAVTANCGQSDVASETGTIDGASIQNLQPTISITNVNNPYCPSNEFSGSFEVTVNDDCGASYNVSVGGTTFFNVPAGVSITFGGLNAAVGGTVYTVNLSLANAGGCQFNTDQTGCVSSVSATQMLTPQDNLAPTAVITAAGGITVEDGLGGGVDAFEYDAPEGECGAQLVWSLGLSDDCGAEVGLANADISFTNGNAGVDAGPSFVLTQTGFDLYSLELFAAIGQNDLVITFDDENGNETTITKTITVNEERAPEIAGPVANGGTMTVQIPACQTAGIPVNFTVVATDNCD